MKKTEQEDLAKIFKVLSNPIRLIMLEHMTSCSIHEHKHNITQLAKLCDVDFSTVSRHLKTLKDAKIIQSSKSKNDVIYEVSSIQLVKKLNKFIKTIHKKT